MNRQWLKITSCYVWMFSILHQWHRQQTRELTENFTNRKYQENENRTIFWSNASWLKFGKHGETVRKFLKWKFSVTLIGVLSVVYRLKCYWIIQWEGLWGNTVIFSTHHAFPMWPIKEDKKEYHQKHWSIERFHILVVK